MPKSLLAALFACGLLLAQAPPAIAQQQPAQTQQQRDGAHDFDFNIGTWTTHLRRLRNPLSGAVHLVRKQPQARRFADLRLAYGSFASFEGGLDANAANDDGSLAFRVNGFYRDSAFVPADDVHVGMAIAMRGGRLVAPAILNADGKPLTTIMSELRDLTLRVRSGHMRASELALSTITLTSLSEEGIELILPVIYPPQVAIVGAGSIVEQPWSVDGTVRSVPAPRVAAPTDAHAPSVAPRRAFGLVPCTH